MILSAECDCFPNVSSRQMWTGLVLNVEDSYARLENSSSALTANAVVVRTMIDRIVLVYKLANGNGFNLLDIIPNVMLARQ